MDYLCRTWAEIDTDAIVHNCKLVKEHCGKDVYAVVKADAYGHGAVVVAKALCESGVVCGFAVSNIAEAEELRAAGISLPILILGYTPVEVAARLWEMDISQCVYSKDYAQALSDAAAIKGKKIKAHLKLDTGMGRLGFDCRRDTLDGIGEAKDALSLGGLDFEGVFTHFSSADSEDTDDVDFTRAQYSRFLGAVEILEADGFKFKTKHCGNSAATLTQGLDETDAVRAGIIMYGLSPDANMPISSDFRPAMSLISVVSEVKEVEADTPINYGRTYTSKSRRKIATVTAGYADGVPRLLSNCGEVLVHGRRAKIVGRVCMDQFCIDVTDIDDVRMGDKVVIFGGDIKADEVAGHAQTINYEIICGISKRVPKVYI